VSLAGAFDDLVGPVDREDAPVVARQQPQIGQATFELFGERPAALAVDTVAGRTFGLELALAEIHLGLGQCRRGHRKRRDCNGYRVECTGSHGQPPSFWLGFASVVAARRLRFTA
jgi:hypothetical protein